MNWLDWARHMRTAHGYSNSVASEIAVRVALESGTCPVCEAGQR